MILSKFFTLLLLPFCMQFSLMRVVQRMDDRTGRKEIDRAIIREEIAARKFVALFSSTL